MWERVYVTTAAVPVDFLWQAASNVVDWPAWDSEIVIDSIGSTSRIGTTYLVKTAGVWVHLRIVEYAAPHHFAYVTLLPLACQRTRFEFDSMDGTRVRISVQLTGPFAFLWRGVLREMRRGWLPEQADRLVRQACQLYCNASTFATLGNPSGSQAVSLRGPL